MDIILFKILKFKTITILCLSISLVVFNDTSAQLKIDSSSYQEYKKEYKYPFDKPIIKKEKQSTTIANPFDQSTLKVVLWSLFAIIVLALLVYLIWRLSKNNSDYISNEESDEIIKKVEENILEANLDDLISKAVLAQNYDLAIKLSYFKVLKKLILKNYIRYRKDKSNKEYLYEVYGQSFFQNYKKLNIEFDRLKYSKIAINTTVYQSFNENCNQFLAQI